MDSQFRGFKPLLTIFVLGLSAFRLADSQGLAHTRCEFMNSSMASCTDKFLISAQLDGLPQILRILVLDRNQINLLENNVFWRTPLLQEVSIAQNRLDSIALNAFQDLPYLRHLNLSYNRLESFNQFILEQNTKMEVLDLSGNNFLYLQAGPLLSSSSLKTLYIRDCKISSLNTMLRNIPNLEFVDLSQNLLGSLEIPSFVSLMELKMVELESNFLKCDKPTQYLMDWFRKNKIRYKGPDCPIQKGSEDGDKFQRMEMSLDKIEPKDIRENEQLRDSSLAKINASHVENELVMSLFNKTYFKRCLLMEHEFVCHLLENCKNSLNCDKYLEEQKKHNSLNFYFIMAIFVIGIFIGAILALCCGQACFYCRTDRQQRRKRRRQQQQRDYLATGMESYPGDDEGDVQMRPMTVIRRGQVDDLVDEDRDGLRRPTRHSQVNGRSLAVQSMPMEESSGFHEFVNELFSRRRSRRQMISAIGQQGTNLVRQLSRSSLNLLRRQQNRAANASARNANAPYTPTSPVTPSSPSSNLYEPLVYEPADAPRTFSGGGGGGCAVIGRSRSFTYSPEAINSNNDDVLEEILRQHRRSESPPPTYDLCVTLPKESRITRD